MNQRKWIELRVDVVSPLATTMWMIYKHFNTLNDQLNPFRRRKKNCLFCLWPFNAMYPKCKLSNSKMCDRVNKWTFLRAIHRNKAIIFSPILHWSFFSLYSKYTIIIIIVTVTPPDLIIIFFFFNFFCIYLIFTLIILNDDKYILFNLHKRSERRRSLLDKMWMKNMLERRKFQII